MPATRNELDVPTHLRRLLNHEETLSQFVDWFMDAYWDDESRSNSSENDLAARIWNRLGGYSSGYVSDNDLITNFEEDAAEFGVDLRESSAA